MASGAKEFIADFGKAIEQMKTQTPEVVNGFMGMFAKTMKAGALDVKQKELIALAVGLAVRCKPCIILHIQKAMQAQGVQRVMRTPLQPRREVLKIRLQGPLVLAPRLPVHARGRLPLEGVKAHPETFDVVDVVPQRRQPQLLIPVCCLPYSPQCHLRGRPVLCPVPGASKRIALGRPPSLHQLRQRRGRVTPVNPVAAAVVRWLLWYYGAV